MNRSLYRALKIFIVAIVIISLLLSFVVSQDSHHIDTCELEHCSVCRIIHMAQNIVNMTVTIFLFVTIFFLIFFFLANAYKTKNTVSVQESLVFRKIQLNE